MVTSINKLAVVRISHQGLTLETKSQDIIHSAVYTVCVCVYVCIARMREYIIVISR